MDHGPDRPGSFWNSKKIQKNLHEIIVSRDLQVEHDQVKEAACDLRLGPEAYVSGAKEKTILKRDGMVSIAPGEIALLLTEEWLNMPSYAVGFISLKTSVKVPGLINVSGFHVDPGFRGRLVFTVYNAGTETCAFIRGQRMFKIWFADLSEKEEWDHGKEPKGKRQNQDTIPAEDISRLTAVGASPAKLDERIRRLEITLGIYGALLLAAVVGLFFKN